MHRALLVLILVAAWPLVEGHGEGDHGDGQAETVLAYGEYLPHLHPWHLELGPGENASRVLAFEGTPMPAGWLLVVDGAVENGSIAVEVVEEPGDGSGPSHAAWAWDAGFQTETVRLQHGGFPQLVVTNVGPGNASAVIAYDQTCDCLGKSSAWEQGSMLFNVDAAAGQRVRFEFNFVPVRAEIGSPPGPFNGTLDVTLRHVVADATGRDVTTLQTWSRQNTSADGSDCMHAGRFNTCMVVAFEAPHDGRQVLLMGTAHDMPGWATQVHPLVEVGGRETPGAAFAWLLAALVAAAVVAGRPP